MDELLTELQDLVEKSWEPEQRHVLDLLRTATVEIQSNGGTFISPREQDKDK